VKVENCNVAMSSAGTYKKRGHLAQILTLYCIIRYWYTTKSSVHLDMKVVNFYVALRSADTYEEQSYFAQIFCLYIAELDNDAHQNMLQL